MKSIVITLILAAGLALDASWPHASAAVDCSRATSNIDRLICSNNRVAAAEERMAFAFHAAVRRGIAPSRLRESQQKWMDEVRDRCNDVDCLIRAFDLRASELDSLEPG